MALGGCYNCLKYLVFVFNFVFWLVGCALLAIGIWAKVDSQSLFMFGLEKNEDISWVMNFFPWTLIIIGSIIMIIGFLGCCGAIRESQCMLATFFIFLFIIFAALLAFGIYAYLEFQEDPEELKKEVIAPLKICVTKYLNNTECQEKLDELHKKFSCCGAETGDMVRTLGLEKAVEACGLGAATQPGCGDKLYDSLMKTIKDFLVIFLAIAFGVATVMLLGMIFSMLLCCAIREAMV